MTLQAEAMNLEALYGRWGAHPDHTPDDWYLEVSNESTRMGYWEWVAAKLEAGEDG